MKMTDFFLAELEREAAGTRRVLERVPDGRNDWKPNAAWLSGGPRGNYAFLDRLHDQSG
jgi:hypothetical protein